MALQYLEDRPVSEIAAILDRAEPTVRVHRDDQLGAPSTVTVYGSSAAEDPWEGEVVAVLDAAGVQSVVVLTIPTNSCPPVLVDLEIGDGQAKPVFTDPGYLGCDDPLLSHTVIAAVDRSFLAKADELVLPAERGYFESPVAAPIEISAGSAFSEPAAPDPDFGAARGHVPLPRRGQAVVGMLDDGAPVFVVHHYDGTISALDPRSESETPGVFALVRWTAATRNLLGAGAWDEYGRRLDGFRAGDLRGFATRVTGDIVEIGSPVEPPSGSPVAVTPDPPAMSDVGVKLTRPIPLPDALALPAGTTAVIDADVVADPDGAFVCAPANTESAFPIRPCPARSPTADGVQSGEGERTIWYGPLLATRAANGFEPVVPTGGLSSEALRSERRRGQAALISVPSGR